MLTCRVSPRLLLPQNTYRMVAYYAPFVKAKTKKAKRACKNAANGVQYGMFRIRPWRNWISQWIPIPKAGGSSPSGRTKKQDVAFAASCFFGPEGAEPPRNFAKQNAALFREGVRNRGRGEQRESAGQVPPWRMIRRAQNPHAILRSKMQHFSEKAREIGAEGSNGKVQVKSLRGGGSGGRRTPTQFCEAKCSTFPRRREK